MIKTDVAVIGSGPGGYIAAIRASQLGAKVVCIEKDRMGGVCLNWGCIPTKCLLRSAEAYQAVQQAAEFGVIAGAPSIDWAKAQARKETIVRQSSQGVSFLLRRAGVQVLQGEATFVAANTLSVKQGDESETVVAKQIIIATGSRPLQVPIPGLDGPNVIDSTGALALEALPPSICIIGGGAIGLEFASLFGILGVQVTVVEMLPRLAPLMDTAIGEELEKELSKQGVVVLTSARVTGVEHTGEGCLVTVETPEGQKQLSVAKVLSAIGRAPNVEGLGLEALGIRPTRKGIQVDNRMRTAVPGIYAIGDVALDGPMLAHVASHQGIVAAEDAVGHPAAMDYAAVPSCIFTLPEAAGVGLTEEQAREQGYDVAVGVFPMSASGKARAMGETQGFVKIVAERKHDAILGLHIVGPHASDLVLEGTLALTLECTLDEIEKAIHPHPALGEAIAEAALAARKRALNMPN